MDQTLSYPPFLWERTADGRNSASDDDVFTDPAITAQDATNANKLAGLGFVADPLTPWASGAGIYVNTVYRFHWNGTAWVAGLAPVLDEEPTTTEGEYMTTPVEPDVPEDVPPEDAPGE